MAATSTPVSESLFRLGLNEALPISDEATTSRVVVNNDVLRTVIFTFDAGQQLTEHASPKPSWSPSWRRDGLLHQGAQRAHEDR